MIEAVFTKDMIEVLRNLKGKVFKSYECLMEANGRTSSTYGNLRINLGRSSVDVDCKLRVVDDYFGEPEEIAAFSCEPADPKKPFVPYVRGVAKAYMVDERIKGVALVRDHVDYDNGACIIDIDVAIAIRTSYHTFTFALESWFDEAITISVAESGHPIDLVSTDELWLGAADLTVSTSRETLAL